MGNQIDQPETLELLAGAPCAACGGKRRTTSMSNMDIGQCAACLAEWNFPLPSKATEPNYSTGIRRFMTRFESIDGKWLNMWKRTWGWRWLGVGLFQRDWEIKDAEPYYEYQIDITTFLFSVKFCGPVPFHFGDNPLSSVIGKTFFVWCHYWPGRWTLNKTSGESLYRHQFSLNLQWPFWDKRRIRTAGMDRLKAFKESQQQKEEAT